MDSIERDLRLAIMAKVRIHAEASGGAVTREYLSGFSINGKQLRLIDTSTGIWNPEQFSCSLSIMSNPKGVFADVIHENGLIDYHYDNRTSGSRNAKLKLALKYQAPLIFLQKIGTALFVPTMPVYVVADDEANRMVKLAVDGEIADLASGGEQSQIEKKYAMRLVSQRLHQPAFRARVLRAYDIRCTVCNLRHAQLLDAAHIIPDSHEDGTASVSNGMSMCKIHHSAYDANFMGISPDFTVAINTKLLNEVDGPMLRHGLQEMHGKKIALPTVKTERPLPEALAKRFEVFKSA